VFNSFDEDGNGRMDVSEIVNLLEGLRENKSSLFEGNHVRALGPRAFGVRAPLPRATSSPPQIHRPTRATPRIHPRLHFFTHGLLVACPAWWCGALLVACGGLGVRVILLFLIFGKILLSVWSTRGC
jgi:hypothetical protein